MKYQLILWRENPQQAVKCYQLRTVTYGVTTAPYLAIKCIKQLAQEFRTSCQSGSEALSHNMYVDDLMTGADSLQEASIKQKQIITILQSAGLYLRKWCSNHTTLLQDIPVADRAPQLEVHGEDECHIKTLGLVWHPKSDEFCTPVATITETKVTKRKVLSEISRLFDPLGIMSPVVVTAKIFLQMLWALKLDWDAAVPQELHTEWDTFRSHLLSLNNIKIPRHVYNHKVPVNVQLHAFCDASQKAYGAAIYMRSTFQDGIISVRLLCAKSRLAPLKTTTLPRLELCAAKLSAQLLSRVKKDLEWKHACYLWTDSEIVLAWLQSASSSYHTFVANRIATIQDLTSRDQWNHVTSKNNPADIISRGLSPEKLESCHLWFYGPLFLHGPESSWPKKEIQMEPTLEKKNVKVALKTTASDYLINQIDHRNSFIHLQRIIAHMIRFGRNCRAVSKSSRQTSEITVEELESSLTLILKEVQQQEFSQELSHLKSNKCVDNKSPISSLTPFLDDKGLIRVGGRLEEALLNFEAKHPIILPYAHPITKLLMTQLHIQHAHTGAQTLLAITRQRFWPIKGKTIARSIVQNCERCVRSKPQVFNQLMGNLPAARVTPARPFINSGVDFCGPF